MVYITSIERILREEVLEEGLRAGRQEAGCTSSAGENLSRQRRRICRQSMTTLACSSSLPS